MIVSAGYFSSIRAPSFQSSHETVVIAPDPAGAPEPAARKPGWHSYAPLLQSADVGASGRAHRAGGWKHALLSQMCSTDQRRCSACDGSLAYTPRCLPCTRPARQHRDTTSAGKSNDILCQNRVRYRPKPRGTSPPNSRHYRRGRLLRTGIVENYSPNGGHWASSTRASAPLAICGAT